MIRRQNLDRPGGQVVAGRAFNVSTTARINRQMNLNPVNRWKAGMANSFRLEDVEKEVN